MALDYLFPLVGYLAGSLASAIIVCRLMGLPDPRSGGSGNPGATNVLRLGGKKAALLTLVGDILKGVLPVLAAHALNLPAVVIALTCLGCFLGHLYPLYFHFQGGKGVATAFGAILALDWRVGLAFGLSWLILAAGTRYSSIASLITGLSAPLAAWLLTGRISDAAALACIAVFIILRHKANIARLLAGTEGKIGQKTTG